MKLYYLVLYCKDVNISMEWYQKIGFTTTIEKHGKEPIHYSMKIGDLVVELYPSKEKRSFIRLGIKLGLEKGLILEDPDGNMIECL